MNPWRDGLAALADHAGDAFILFFVIAWGIFIMRGILLRFFGDLLDEADVLSLSSAGWVLPVLLLSLLTLGISILTSVAIGVVLTLALIFIPVFFFAGKRPDPFPLFASFAVLIPTVILRFAFIRDLVLPSYFDSAQHYRLINSFIESHRTGVPVIRIEGGYFHLGFHSIIAGIAQFTGEDVIDLMLVAGPLFLAFLPITFFFIVKRETNSLPAAILACLLAGFGFHMPAHLMNWGKYPALLGLFCMSFVLILAYLAYRNNSSLIRKSALILLGFALPASILIHSRTLIVYGLALIAAFLTAAWNRLRMPYRITGFIILVFLLLVEIFALQNNPALETLLDGYLKNDSWILVLVFLLAFLSAAHFTEPTFFLTAFLALCAFCLFFPVPLPGIGVQTLLDRPFVQMLAFIPLSLLGGLGFAGLIRTTARLFLKSKLMQPFVTFFVFGLVLLNTALHYDFHPSDCCRFVNRDDLAAFSWMDEFLPRDATVLIASTGLYVTAFESPQVQTGVDAGIWIRPLLSRNVELTDSNIRFDQEDSHRTLCNRGVDYIYVGSTLQSFDASQLESQPDRYLPSFILPTAKIYRLAECK